LLLVLSKDWRSQVTGGLAVWKVNGEKARELQPPPQFQENHQVLVEASQYFDRAADLATQGMENLNSSKVQQAVTEGLLGYNALTRYSEELEKHLD
jgi:hypothetical protein